MWVNPKDYKVVGSVLAAARVDADLTQSEIAKRLKKPQSFVSSYERGQRRIDVLELLAIATALGLRPTDILAEVLKRLRAIGRYS